MPRVLLLLAFVLTLGAAGSADEAEPTASGPTCEVVVRLSGPATAISGAWVTVLTTDPEPQLRPEALPEDEAWYVDRHPNPSASAGRDGVARVRVPADHQVHGVVVKNGGADWVWSSTLLPTPREVDGSGACVLVIDHSVPFGGGSLRGRVLAIDGSVHRSARVTALLTPAIAAHAAWDAEHVAGFPFGAEVDEFGRFQLSGIAGEFELYASARDFVPLWTWHGTLEPGAELRGLDLLLAPSMQLHVSIPALVDQPRESVRVTARLAASERSALLEHHGIDAPAAPPPGVERNDRVASAFLDAHGRVSLSVPQRAVWVSAVRGGAPLPLRHDDERVFEVLYDPVHGPLTLIVEE